MIIFFFTRNRKLKHSNSYGLFYFEEKSKKERFIAVNSGDKWYLDQKKVYVL